MVGPARGRGKVMASKSRPRRITAAVEKRAASERRSAARGAAGEQPVRAAAPGPERARDALATFAHDIRTPLTGILRSASLFATSDIGERERQWVDRHQNRRRASLPPDLIDSYDAARAEATRDWCCGGRFSTYAARRRDRHVAWRGGPRPGPQGRVTMPRSPAVVSGDRAAPARSTGKPDRQR